jgi:hypothetical protein
VPASFGMSSEALVSKRRARAPDMTSAPDPHLQTRKRAMWTMRWRAIPKPPTCTRSYPGMSSLTTAEGDKWGLDVISRDVMSWEPVAGDKRSALDAPDTDDDDDQWSQT